MENRGKASKQLSCGPAAKRRFCDISVSRVSNIFFEIAFTITQCTKFNFYSRTQVTHFVSRDLDSRFSARETAAVNDWLKSNKAFHFMRDHPAHAIEILGKYKEISFHRLIVNLYSQFFTGSGWGVRMRDLERGLMEGAFRVASNDSMFWAPRTAYGPDQGFLKRQA